MTGKLRGHLVAWQAPTTLDTFRTSMAVVVATRSDKWCPNSKFCYRPRPVGQAFGKETFNVIENQFDQRKFGIRPIPLCPTHNMRRLGAPLHQYGSAGPIGNHTKSEN